MELSDRFPLRRGVCGNTQLLNSQHHCITDMADYLSESDLKRMKQFASTPKYERDPDQLVPQDAD